MKNLLGMKLKIVTGYRSPGDMALAASRNEIEAFANTIGGAAGARRPWVELGQMRVLFNFEPEPVPGLGVPTVFEFVKTDEQRKILTFFASNVLSGRPIMAPPGVPAERVTLLRRAFEATMKDPALLKEADGMSFEITPQTGERIAELVATSRRRRPRSSAAPNACRGPIVPQDASALACGRGIIHHETTNPWEVDAHVVEAVQTRPSAFDVEDVEYLRHGDKPLFMRLFRPHGRGTVPGADRAARRGVDRERPHPQQDPSRSVRE